MTWQNVQDRVLFLTGTQSGDWSLVDFNNAVGRAIERVVSLINKSNSAWEYDDSNYTDLPFATYTITSGQQQYSLATTHQTVNRIEVKDSSGNWKRIKQIDQQILKRGRAIGAASGQLEGMSGEDTAIALGETAPSTGRSGAYLSTPGTPLEYDLIGIRLFLFPVPNYTLAKAMRIYFNRAPLLFVYTLLGSSATGAFSDSTGDITASPGFNSLFHDLIPLWMSYDYGLKVGKQNTDRIFLEIQRKEQALNEFYGQRNRDVRPQLIPAYEDNR